ncbi:timeless protein-domain-containing protein [Obelidium mucronatum]|nr:timeless protein-domain-containing protein [Obelidium mucronatum]
MDPSLAFSNKLEETRLARQDADRNRVLNICSAIGGFEEDEASGTRVYRAGDEAVECLRDLKKILRFDNETAERKVFGIIGEWNVLARDLLPLLLVTDTAMLIVELLVPLTWAVSDEYKHSPNQVEVLLKYKEAFLNESVLQKIVQVLLKSLAIPWRDRREKDNAKIRLILTLFRNLLAIKDPEASVGASSEFHYRASLQEKLLLCFYNANVLQLILTFAASMEEKEFSDYNMIILEIVYLMFRDRSVASILESTQVLEAETLLKLAKQELITKSARPMKRRHSRFGGTLSLSLGNGKLVNFYNPTTALKSVESAMDIGKTKGRTTKKGQSEAVTKNAIRNEKAKAALRETADSFLENSFNALIASVKDDIDKERQHVVEGDYLRFLVVVKFFLEYQVELLKVTDEEGKEKYDFDTVTDFINSRSMMFVTKRMQIYLEEKNWSELQSSLECLKQMLITLNAMAVCGNEEFQDASNNIQNNLYYEAYIIEAIAHLCKSYKDQSFGYLKNLVETVHIFLKMLEKFSKSKAFMVVRRKKRQQKAKSSTSKKGLTAEETSVALPANEEEEDGGFQDENYVKRQCTEHEFQFGKIEMDFAYENVVHTYVQLLQGYHELEPKYLHYATTLLHRVFIKAKMEPLLYKLSTLELFNRIILDEKTMEPSKEFKELKEFIRYVVKKFVAKAKEYPLLFVEVLFPKNRSDCRRILHGADDDDNMNGEGRDDNDGDGEFGKKKADALSDGELEVQRDLTWSQKVGVIVSIMAQEDKVALLEWLETTLTSVATKRMFDEEQPDVEIQNFDLTEAAAPLQNVSTALKKDKKLHLLLELMKVTKFIEGDSDIRWIIEKERSADDIISDVKFIRHFIEEPLDPQGKPLHKMIKKKPKKRAPKKKAEKEEDGDEEEEKENKKKKPEKVPQAFLSLTIPMMTDDAAFFEAERQRRLKAAELAWCLLLDSSETKKHPASTTAKATVEKTRKKSDIDMKRKESKQVTKKLSKTVSKKPAEKTKNQSTKSITSNKRSIFSSDEEEDEDDVPKLSFSKANSSPMDLTAPDTNLKRKVESEEAAPEESAPSLSVVAESQGPPKKIRKNMVFDSDSD